MAQVVFSAAGSALGNAAGNAVGSAATSAVLSTAFSAVGAAAGRYVDNWALSKALGTDGYGPAAVGPKLQDTAVQVSTYGKTIPIVFGRFRMAGNVIWAQDLKEVKTEVGGGGGGKGSGLTARHTDGENVQYSYFATLAISLCEGPVDEIVRVWADSLPVNEELLGTVAGNYSKYLGGEDQLPDPIMESFEGEGNVPAYRGQAYVVIRDLPLEKFGNRIPNFTFEVIRQVRPTPEVEDNIKSIMLIPASGEYVYDTEVQIKNIVEDLGGGEYMETGESSVINMHNFQNVANIHVALDNLEKAFPNLEWVGVGISWFATSKFCDVMEIIPKTEFSTGAIVTPDPWEVGSYNRSNAQEVLRFDDDTPTYGGTPSDLSVIRLCQELKDRGYNVMFYPLLQVDTIEDETEENKPWRGRITPTSTDDVDDFFTAYNPYIMHYAELEVDGVALKDLVDAFVIGTEMRGLTQWSSDGSGTYPAVDAFKTLAASVKTALGAGPLVTYAADWSEYHSVDGWFNLDPLWADSNIDFIGIDAYFPLTPDLPQSSSITKALIKEYWEAGEGWDYYYDDSENRTSNLTSDPLSVTDTSTSVTLDLTGFVDHHLIVGNVIVLSGLTSTGGIDAANINGSRTITSVPDSTHVVFTAGAAATSTTTGGGSAGKIDKPKYFSGEAYAWKNLEYWWKNTHTNPDASGTSWTAKMKPIWFTEYGFPSVDACSNQPNVFYDPNSIESFFPRGSKGRVNFQAQRVAIAATEEYLQERSEETGNANLVPQRFLWTWDARPFPQWPDLRSVWQDGDLWKTGHWVQGKLGASNLGAIVKNLLRRVGLSNNDFDVSRLTDIVEGYVIPRAQSCRDCIEELRGAYFFDAVESDGLIKFVRRADQQSVVTIPEDDLVPMSTQPIREVFTISRRQELELPQKITIAHVSREHAYQTSTQVAQRQTVNTKQLDVISLPLVLSDQEAKTIADVTLYNAWVSRNAYTFVLPPKYIAYEPTDLVTVTVNNVNHLIRLTDAKVGQFGLITCQGISEDLSSYDSYTPPGEPPPVEEVPTVIPKTTLRLLDLPPLPLDTDDAGAMHVAMYPGGSNWRGGVLYRSNDGGEEGGNTWSVIAATSQAATAGFALTELENGITHVMDTENTVDVFLVAGELESVPFLALLNGANAAVLGDEIIQFQTATIIDGNPQKLRLSNLLRGRQGTEHSTGNHAVGERFVILTSAMLSVTMPISLFGLSRYYKPVTVGATLANTDEESFTYSGIRFKPWSVVHVAGERDNPSGNDWTITWVRRTRFGGELRDGVDIPLNEQSESYEIDIMDGADVVRTLTSTTPTVVYTEAQQITDFGSAQSSIDIVIYQMSAVVGRGYGAEVTL